MSLDEFLGYMCVTIESYYFNMDFYINWIDSFIADNDDIPFIFIELSLSKTADNFITTIKNYRYTSIENYEESLIGFLILSYKEGKITKSIFERELIGIFDAGNPEYTVEQLTHNLETTSSGCIGSYLKRLEQSANVIKDNLTLYMSYEMMLRASCK